VLVSDGSTSFLDIIARTLLAPGLNAVTSERSFIIYPLVTKLAGGTLIQAPMRNDAFDLDAVLAAIDRNTRVVFIANPNNPTGTYLSTNEMARLHAGLPNHVVLAIDAAYSEFVNRNDYEPGIGLVNRAENVVMLRTFSKIYALAGLRLGWAYCPPAIADVLNRIRGPFNVTAPALAAGVAAVEDVRAVARARAHNDRWLPWLSERLAALGLELTPSVGNFALPRFPDDPRRNADAAFAFLQSRGIIIRKMGAYGLPQHLRITIGTGEENEAVAAALAEFMAGT
jgi:histidinol-phosphate aminotransferase